MWLQKFQETWSDAKCYEKHSKKLYGTKKNVSADGETKEKDEKESYGKKNGRNSNTMILRWAIWAWGPLTSACREVRRLVTFLKEMVEIQLLNEKT